MALQGFIVPHLTLLHWTYFSQIKLLSKGLMLSCGVCVCYSPGMGFYGLKLALEHVQFCILYRSSIKRNEKALFISLCVVTAWIYGPLWRAT